MAKFIALKEHDRIANRTKCVRFINKNAIIELEEIEQRLIRVYLVNGTSFDVANTMIGIKNDLKGLFEEL